MIENAQLLIIVAGLLGLTYLVFTLKRKDIIEELLYAFILSLIWVLFSGLYMYKHSNYIIWGINLFALVAWTAGLVLSKEIYEWMKSVVPKDIFAFIGFVGLYWLIIITVEWIGYNWLGIQLASNYSGLFGLEMMHMPWYGQLYYMTIAPIYVLVMDTLGVK